MEIASQRIGDEAILQIDVIGESGAASAAAAIARTVSSGSMIAKTPFWKQCCKKMSPKLGAMIARNTESHQRPHRRLARAAASKLIPASRMTGLETARD